MDRIINPYKKMDDNFVKITFSDAFDEIFTKIKQYRPNEILVMANGCHSNEELYLVQKFARAGIKTNAIASTEYLGRGSDFCFDKNDIIPFGELVGSSCYYCLGFDRNSTHETLKPIFAAFDENSDIPVCFFNKDFQNITDYYSFFRAVNFHLISNDKAKGKFVHGLGKNFEKYKSDLLDDNYDKLLKNNHLNGNNISDFVDKILKETSPAFIYWEKDFSENAIHEMVNFSMLIDAQVKTASGLLGIKENINSQGLFDMGIFPHLSVGGHVFDEAEKSKMEQYYSVEIADCENVDIEKSLLENKFKVCILFGENPVGEGSSLFAESLSKMDFVVVHDASLTATAKLATIVLPASLPSESDGIFTDSTRSAEKVLKSQDLPIQFNNIEQLSMLGEKFGLPRLDNVDDIFLEYISFFKAGCNSANRHFFK